MHAIAEMVGRLRERGDGAGLVTANGGYLTKHAAGVYATQPGDRLWEPRKRADAAGDAASPTRPAVAHEAKGELTLEAHTVHYSRGEPSRGIVVGRLADGRRGVAISDDGSTIERLISGDCVGEAGPVAPADGLNHFRF
jgi:acetyl-CoA C-acetyltransferase